MSAAPEPLPARRPRKREAIIGAVAVAATLAAIVFAGIAGIRHVRAAARAADDNGVLRRQAVERKKTEHAANIVSTLASAVDSLSRLQSVGGAAFEQPVDPPAPTEFVSSTACMLTYLPEVDVPPDALGFVCEETDFWAIEWKVRARVANRVGDGARLWNRLGPYSLAALASMRKGCCVDPPYLQAKVPGLWCGILRDTLRGFQASPTLANVRDYETMMKCLEGRGMHLPSHFGETPPERARDAYVDFVKISRKRTSASARAGHRPETP